MTDSQSRNRAFLSLSPYVSLSLSLARMPLLSRFGVDSLPFTPFLWCSIYTDSDGSERSQRSIHLRRHFSLSTGSSIKQIRHIKVLTCAFRESWGNWEGCKKHGKGWRCLWLLDRSLSIGDVPVSSPYTWLPTRECTHLVKGKKPILDWTKLSSYSHTYIGMYIYMVIDRIAHRLSSLIPGSESIVWDRQMLGVYQKSYLVIDCRGMGVSSLWNSVSSKGLFLCSLNFRLPLSTPRSKGASSSAESSRSQATEIGKQYERTKSVWHQLQEDANTGYANGGFNSQSC